MDKSRDKEESKKRFAEAALDAVLALENRDWDVFGPTIEIEKGNIRATMWKTYFGGFEIHFFDLEREIANQRGHAELAAISFAHGKVKRFDCLTTRIGNELLGTLRERGHIQTYPRIITMSRKIGH